MTQHRRSSVLLAAVVALLAGNAACAAGADDVPVLDKQRVEELVPHAKVRSVTPVPMRGGLYEIIDEQGAVFYMDGAGKIGFQCEIMDVATKRSLTQESLARLRAVEFDALPKDLAIKRVKGDGSRRLAVFADPECPYCRSLEQELAQVDNVTVYTYLYPIEALHPGATERAAKIWCGENPDAAWRTWLLEDKASPMRAGACESPVPQIAELARQHMLAGTPSMVFGSGRVFTGSLAAKELEEYLDEPTLQRPAATPAGAATGH